MALEVDITKKLDGFFMHVKFQVEEEIFAILGASGCGKSMTLKCIAGIEKPDAGRIVLDGRVLFDSEKKINLPPQKRKVGYMFQDYALFPHMNVVQNIEAGMGRRPDRSRTESFIRQFQLEGLEKRNPEQLSGGQKQRVAMARMLAAEPELILLDEPFSALDTYLKWQLEQEMQDQLRKIRKPVIFVSHNRDEVYRLCDTVSCMNHGKIEVMEPMKEFFQNPKTRTAAILSGCKNISMAVRKDAHTLEALEWGVTLHLKKRRIPENICAVGIRAHFLTTHRKKESGGPILLKQEERTANEFPVGETRIWEDPFEWNISFRKNGECAWMQWKIAKTDWNPEMGIPDRLYLKEEDILLLTDPHITWKSEKESLRKAIERLSEDGKEK